MKTDEPVDAQSNDKRGKVQAAEAANKAASALDPRDGGNITPQGTVLFLDEERLRRKEHPERPLFAPHPHGLGIKDWVVTGPLATTPKTWNRTISLFHFLIDNMHRLGEHDLVAEAFKRLMMAEPQEGTYTHGNVMQLNLDIDLSDQARTVVAPYDLLMDMIDRAGYIAQMHHCLCRSAGGCTDGRENVGCLFLNTSGIISVKNGIADEVTKEQAKAHVREAMELGLMGHVLWVQLEQIIWAVPNQKMDELVEICFCDPEYCVALRSIRAGDANWKERFHSSGFTAVLNHDECIACGTCAEKCPQSAITRDSDGRTCIDQEICMGCGFCKEACEQHAIDIKQTMPLRGSVDEYFEKEGRIKLAACSSEPPAANYSWAAKQEHSWQTTKHLVGAAAIGAALAGAALLLMNRR